MARTPLLAGNWKMHCTRAEATALAAGLAKEVGNVAGREVVLGPPATALEAVVAAVRGTTIGVAAQNVHWEPKGAFTGELSVGMLKDVGCSHVIIGHSERRQFFGETDASVNQRTKAALAGGITPIVCVGETLAERDGGTTMAVIGRQIAGGLKDIPAADVARLVVAYEPVWAIGTGRTATPGQAQEVHAAIRKQLGDLAGPTVAAGVRILYGGSVKADNVDSLMAQTDIDGALVGGASLEVASFARIVRYEGSKA